MDSEPATQPTTDPTPVIKETGVSQAIRKKDFKLATKLLNKGADPNDPTGGDTPLWHALGAFGEGDCDLEFIDLLLEKGADTKYCHEEYGCHNSSSESCWQRCVSVALRKDRGDLMVLFLKYGGNPNEEVRETFGGMRTDGVRIYYPIHLAMRSAQCVQALLKAGADPNSRNKTRIDNERGYNQNSSYTPVHESISHATYDVLKALLEGGANPDLYSVWLDQVDSGVKSPTDDPRSHGYRSSVKCVPNSSTPLIKAIREGKLDFAKLLVIHGADVNYAGDPSTSKGATPISLCKGKPEWELALSGTYQPTDWKLYPKQSQDQMLTLALCNTFCKWKLPKDVLHVLFTFILRANRKQHTKEDVKLSRTWNDI